MAVHTLKNKSGKTTLILTGASKKLAIELKLKSNKDTIILMR